MVLVAQPELGALALQIKQHWKKYRPRMSRELEQAGHLDESVSAAAELTSHVLHDLIFQKGLPRDRAEELVMHQWAFLPSEKEQPVLGVDPNSFPAMLPEASGPRVPDQRLSMLNGAPTSASLTEPTSG